MQNTVDLQKETKNYIKSFVLGEKNLNVKNFVRIQLRP